MRVLALIPARSGSKGIVHKNIATFHGKPLMAHSIEHALRAETVNRVLVSTDSALYADIARQHGAEAPFLRPAEISGDLSTDLECFQHALAWLKEHEGYAPDICVHLRPTNPTRRWQDIDRAVRLLQSDPGFDSVRTVTRAPETPFKMWFMGEDGALSPVVQSDLKDPWNMARQALPATYLQTASVDVVWARVIHEQASMTGQRIRGLLQEELHDIDDPRQMAQAAEASEMRLTGKRFVFDFDGVIATLTPANRYDVAEPIGPTVELVNRLHDLGNTIVIFTARGSATGIDWSEVTRRQLADWGVKYHELRFGKPHADYYVDDRLISVDELRKRLDRPQ